MKSSVIVAFGALLVITLCLIFEQSDATTFVVVGRNLRYVDALRACRARRMEIATVINRQQNMQLYNFAKRRRLGKYWINANDRKREGRFVYANGKSLRFSRWHRGEPNNYGHNEDCVHGQFYGNGAWNDINCETKNTAVCNGRAVRPGRTIHKHEISYVGKNMNYNQALQACRNRGQRLIRVTNAQTNTILFNLAKSMRVGRYWINADDRRIEGQFTYDNNHPIQYTKWQQKEPNNYYNEDCVHGLYYPNGFWNDIKCNSRNAVFCYKRGRKTATRSSIRKSELVIAARRVNYQNAVRACASRGLKLIRIKDDATNTMVYNWAKSKGTGWYWIDGNDIKNENKFVYTNGQSIVYRKFHQGEPNGRRGENCIHGLRYNNGFWNDVNCNNAGNTAICYGKPKPVEKEVKVIEEKEPETRVITKTIEKEAFLIDEMFSFKEAIEFCNKNGLHLLKLEDANMNTEIMQMLKHMGVKRAWINGKKSGSGWKTTDGGRVSYLNFRSGQPDCKSTCCITLNSGDGKWTDEKCDTAMQVVCVR